MISEHFIKVEKTARYYLIEELNKNVDSILFALHGYGQLARNFINVFENTKSKNYLIIAPEAINKFYLKSFYGEIGSTWMTKEDRINEIEDYVKMLNKIYKEVTEVIVDRNFRINILGFSQGTHTAVRWLNKSKLKVENLILWSGSLPNDINYSDNYEYWKNLKIKIVFGNKDKFITAEQFDEQKLIFEKNELDYELITFEGGHEIKPETLKEVLNKINL